MRFSIVTPSWNKARFLAQAIESVISQEGQFSIDYVVVDNCSDDGTLDILAGYQRRVAAGDFSLRCQEVRFSYISQPDSGMYDAVNRGFGLVRGEVCAYLNADDCYLPGAFDAVARTFERYGEIRWLKGVTSYIDEHGNLTEQGRCYLYHRPWIREGIYGREAYFVQQDSVFWRESLWCDAGGIDIRYRRAGDYYLWRAFAALEPLYSLDVPVSCFRRYPGQLSEDHAAYLAECRQIVPEHRSLLRLLVGLYFAHGARLPGALARQLYWFLFHGQNLNLVELRPGNAPQLRQGAFYVA